MSRLVISLATAVLVTGIGVFDPRAANAADFATVQASAPSGTNGTSGGMAYGLDMLSMNNEVCVGGEVGLPITGAIGVVMRPMILGSGSPSSLDVGGRVEMRFQT
ncbi:MAG TPA: hypothetical protein VFP91_21695, partial [Vicinamibacterales bacterium]|nr:hypothetical protein [Vicinamibacterales bacterium]